MEKKKETEIEYGVCSFCGDNCNPLSQGCSSCLRKLTKYSIGWEKFPPHLQFVYSLKSDDNSKKPEEKPYDKKN